jgi:hypothetical protein
MSVGGGYYGLSPTVNAWTGVYSISVCGLCLLDAVHISTWAEQWQDRRLRAAEWLLFKQENNNQHYEKNNPC